MKTAIITIYILLILSSISNLAQTYSMKLLTEKIEMLEEGCESVSKEI
jgi:hypothetical protein